MRIPTLLDQTPLMMFLSAAAVPPISAQTLVASPVELPAHTEMPKLLMVAEGLSVLPLMWKMPIEHLGIVSILMPVFCTCEIVLPLMLASTDPAPWPLI